MATYVGLDPGGTVGWAAKFGTGVEASEHPTYESGQVHPDAVWGILDAAEDLVLFVEGFKLRRVAHVDLTPVEVIGVVKEFARQRSIQLTLQEPAAVKKYFTDDRLKERGLYEPGQPHANDAMRHLLYGLKEF